MLVYNVINQHILAKSNFRCKSQINQAKFSTNYESQNQIPTRLISKSPNRVESAMLNERNLKRTNYNVNIKYDAQSANAISKVPVHQQAAFHRKINELYINS